MLLKSLNEEMLNIVKGLSKAKALGHNTLFQELCSKLASVPLDRLLEPYNQNLKLKTIHITHSVKYFMHCIKKEELLHFKFFFGSLPSKTPVWEV